MSKELFSNNAQTTLAGAITNVALTANLSPGSGVLFPAPIAGQYFTMTFVDSATGLINEIVWVTNVTGDVITMLRAQEGTTAKAWLAGDIAANFMTAGSAAKMTQDVQVQSNAYNYAADTGTANNYAVALSPAVGLVGVEGPIFYFKAAHTNNGASNITFNGGTTYSLIGLGLAALAGGEIFAGGYCGVTYNTALDKYELLFCSGGALQLPAGTYMAGRFVQKVAANIASAATINLATATGNGGHVTGTTAITAVTLSGGQFYEIIFDGILTLTHHATNNNLPTAANITTAAGDRAYYWSDGVTSYCLLYVRADGTPLALRAVSVTAGILDGAQTGGAKIFADRAYATWNGATTGQYTPTLPSGNINDINRLGVGLYKLTFITNPNVSGEFAALFDCDSPAITLGVPQTLPGLHQIVAKDATSVTVQFYSYVGSTNTASAYDPSRAHMSAKW